MAGSTSKYANAIAPTLSRAAVYFLFLLPSLLAQPARVEIDTIADLRACVNRPAGSPLVCALKNSPSPYAVSGDGLIIRRSDTTIEGIAQNGQDPPTLKRTDPTLKKMIWVAKTASHVTIRNLQLDGNQSIVPGQVYFDISAEGSFVTIEDNYFGNSTKYCIFIGGPHVVIRNNTFGKLMVKGSSREAPGIDTAIKAWGANATQFTIESNNISNYRGAMSITDVPNGSDPASASIISKNTLYHDAICVPDCGGGALYVAGSSNVKIVNNTINGGWEESANRDTVHSYGIEIENHASYVYAGSNEILNNSISGFWIGNGANHITLENNNVHNNGLNGVQVAGNGKLAPVSDVSIIGLKSNHNDLHRGPRAPYPTLPRFWGVMIQNSIPDGVCIQTDSNLDANARGAVYSEARRSFSRSDSCPRPYN